MRQSSMGDQTFWLFSYYKHQNEIPFTISTVSPPLLKTLDNTLITDNCKTSEVMEININEFQSSSYYFYKSIEDKKVQMGSKQEA